MSEREELVKSKMAELLRQPLSKFSDDSILSELVPESFALVEMVIELQETFEVRLMQEDLKAVRTVGDLTRLVAGRMQD